MVLLVLALVGALQLGLVYSYPTGPPVANHSEICKTMLPHHDSTPKAHSTSIVDIIPEYITNGIIKVTLKTNHLSTANNKIEGLFVQMRASDDGDPIGTWTVGVDPVLSTLTCNGNPKNAVGHNQEEKADERVMFWKPPSETDIRTVKVYATVVAHKADYWVKLKSNEVSICSGVGTLITSTLLLTAALLTALVL